MGQCTVGPIVHLLGKPQAALMRLNGFGHPKFRANRRELPELPGPTRRGQTRRLPSQCGRSRLPLTASGRRSELWLGRSRTG